MTTARSPIESTVRAPSTGSPSGALILIHGRGADAGDLEPLLSILDPDRRLLGVFPRGPLSLPPGGRHWYIVREIGFPDRDTFLPTFAELAEHIDGVLAEHGLDWNRAAVGGFSQGAVMSYALGLGEGRPRPSRDPRLLRVRPDRRWARARPRLARRASRLHRPRIARPGHRRGVRPPGACAA